MKGFPKRTKGANIPSPRSTQRKKMVSGASAQTQTPRYLSLSPPAVPCVPWHHSFLQLKRLLSCRCVIAWAIPVAARPQGDENYACLGYYCSLSGMAVRIQQPGIQQAFKSHLISQAGRWPQYTHHGGGGAEDRMILNSKLTWALFQKVTHKKEHTTEVC